MAKSRKATKDGARKARLAELNTEARRLKDNVKRMRKAVPQLHVAADELRQHAYAWLAAVRTRIQSLSAEVNAVLHDTGSDTVLGRVLDPVRLSAVAGYLDQAECAAADMRVEHFDPTIPPLLLMVKHAEKAYPLAAEGAKLFAEPEGQS